MEEHVEYVWGSGEGKVIYGHRQTWLALPSRGVMHLLSI